MNWFKKIDRRAFLKNASLITSTSGLSQLLFSSSAHALYNLAMFWRKPGSTVSYPASSGTDPYWDYVSFLANMDTPTPSTGFTNVFADDSNLGKSPTLTGSPCIEFGTSPYSGGVGSAKFNGTSDYFTFANSSALQLSTTLTIEGYFKLASTASNFLGICGLWNASGNRRSYTLGVDNSKLSFAFSAAGSSVTSINGGTTLSAGTWYHAAIVVSSGAATLYLNGSVEATGTVSGIYTNSTDSLTIGALEAGSGLFPGYVSDLRIYNQLAKYTSAFSKPTSAMKVATPNDKYWGYCVLACPFEYSLKDMSGSTMSRIGSPTLSTSTYKFGTASASFDGSSYLSLTGAPFTTGIFDFTIEFWMYSNAGTSAYRRIISTTTDGFSSNTLCIREQNTGQLAFAVGNTQSSSVAFSRNTWNHVALVRQGTTFTLYLNGTQAVQMTDSSSISETGAFIGGYYAPNSTEYYQGYLDSVRVTKGMARYTANFTPPTASFPIGKNETTDPFWSSTVLAMHMDDLTDFTSRHTITNVGSVTFPTTRKMFGAGSALVPASGAYLSMASHSDIAISGTTDFTAEFWLYWNNIPSATKEILTVPVSGGFELWYSPSGNNFAFSSYAQTYQFGATNQFVAGQWYHIAVTRAGTTLQMFINGVRVALNTGNSQAFAQGEFCIGGSSADSTRSIDGYIDDLRITKGVARYIQNFNPPTRAFATS